MFSVESPARWNTGVLPPEALKRVYYDDILRSGRGKPERVFAKRASMEMCVCVGGCGGGEDLDFGIGTISAYRHRNSSVRLRRQQRFLTHVARRRIGNCESVVVDTAVCSP